MRIPVNNTRAARSPQRNKSVAGSSVKSGASLPAPVGGWDALHPLAEMPPNMAVVLDNWFPEPGYVRIRRGSQVYCDGLGASAVETIMVYNGINPINNRMFGCADGAIYDVSSSGSAPPASVSGLSNNRWQYVNITTSGGHFLWACNGTDSPVMYDGTSWSNPSLTGITVSDAIHVNVHKSRLWIILKDSMSVAYLGTNAVSGSATTFPLGAVMGKGGYIMAMATWTHDGGNGPDDYAVFLSSRGQAAVYQGTDPASSDTWSLVGVYDMGAPLGRRCLTKVSGDLAVLCIDGILPFSVARGVDRGAAATVAITANINNAMNDAARSFGGNFGWQLLPYPRGTAAILNVPISQGNTQYQYVMNTITGAWCRYKGMNANCWAIFNDEPYFGGNDGNVYKADTSGADVDVAIDAIGQSAYNYYGSQGTLKQFKMVQPIITTDSPIVPAIGISTDFKDNAVLGTPTAVSAGSSVFDVAIFDTDVFAVESRISADWTSIPGLGMAASIHFRAQTNTIGNVTLRLNSVNVLFEKGGTF